MDNNTHFIVFEGIDGSGKSTQIKLFTKKLKKMNIDFIETREPTNLPVGQFIRKYLTHDLKADNRVLSALFTADRLDHILNEKEGLLQTLKEGKNIICDRYYFSSYAYQSEDTGMNWVIEANSLAAKLLKPTYTVFIDTSPNNAIKRMKSRGQDKELFETIEKLTEVREKYFQAFNTLNNTENILIVDGNNDKNTVADNIWDKLKHLYQCH